MLVYRYKEVIPFKGITSGHSNINWAEQQMENHLLRRSFPLFRLHRFLEVTKNECHGSNSNLSPKERQSTELEVNQ